MSGAGATGGEVDATPRVVLVESAETLPGLLPFHAWEALRDADVILARDAATHPSQPHLAMAGLELENVEPAALERGDLDLTRPGAPEDRRVAKALLQRARQQGRAVYLLGPDDQALSLTLAGMAPDGDVEIELVFLAQQPRGTELLGLVEVMARLRDPEGGCPWDLQHDHASLVRYLVEETYELIDAIELGHDADLAEELGDVLLQVVFHAQVASDRGAFTIDDVARGIAEKLVRRHPHVFSDVDARTPAEVQANWDELKAAEKGRASPLDGVPAALPGLVLLDTLQREATKLGLDPLWIRDSSAALTDGFDQLISAGEPAEAEEAGGDVLFALVAAVRRAGGDVDAAARAAARRFRERLEQALHRARDRGIDPATLDRAGWLELWEGTDQPQ